MIQFSSLRQRHNRTHRPCHGVVATPPTLTVETHSPPCDPASANDATGLDRARRDLDEQMQRLAELLDHVDSQEFAHEAATADILSVSEDRPLDRVAIDNEWPDVTDDGPLDVAWPTPRGAAQWQAEVAHRASAVGGLELQTAGFIQQVSSILDGESSDGSSNAALATPTCIQTCVSYPSGPTGATPSAHEIVVNQSLPLAEIRTRVTHDDAMWIPGLAHSNSLSVPPRQISAPVHDASAPRSRWTAALNVIAVVAGLITLFAVCYLASDLWAQL